MKYIMNYAVVFLVGIIIGSFLNVCIFRIPERKNVILGRSRCKSCGKTLRWYELIPLFSYLIQKGRCRSCKAGISVQYPLVELSNGLLYMWIFAVKGWTAESVLYCVCTSALIVIGIIDWRMYEIPAACNMIIGILGLIRMSMDLPHWYDYVAGFFTVSGLFLAVYLLSKGKGIGGGDIKLMAAAGLMLGWKNVLLALMIGSVSGSVIHITLMKLKGKDRILAFGPYLALGIFAAMLYGEQIIEWYLNKFIFGAVF